MNTYNAFIKMFGEVTITEATLCIGALVFMYGIYKKLSDKIVQRHDAEQERMAKLEESYDCVHNKYPEYRQQSLQIQKELTARMDSMGAAIDGLAKTLADMKEITDRRDRSRLKDRLLQAYRYYTNAESNPNHTWTNMEAEAFWDMFSDYEDAGGDGFMHTTVQPEMQKLKVVYVNAEI